MKHSRPHILITNDDGIHALGIRHLWYALKDIADVAIVAPSEEHSCVGLSITVFDPLRIEKVLWLSNEAQAWSVTGTPSDCVRMALSVILPDYPDLIISGINRGSNAGRRILYSGTIGAVIEGVMHGIPGMAVSLEDYVNPSFESIEEYIPRFVDYILNHPLPSGTFFNVNFPSQSENPILGIRMVRQGNEYCAESPEKREHPTAGNFSYYWLGSKIVKYDEDDDSDIAWLQKGYATAVPININELTNRIYIKEHGQIFEKAVNVTKHITNKKV